MMLKTRMPNGSSRRRPTGNFFCRELRRHCTMRLVLQTMRVQRRSRAESTVEARREREPEEVTAMILPMRRRMLAKTLMLMAHFARLPAFRRRSFSSSGRKS